MKTSSQKCSLLRRNRSSTNNIQRIFYNRNFIPDRNIIGTFKLQWFAMLFCKLFDFFFFCYLFYHIYMTLNKNAFYRWCIIIHDFLLYNTALAAFDMHLELKNRNQKEQKQKEDM